MKKNSYDSFYKEVLEIMRKPVMSVLPGHLSFFLLLSSIPIILIFGVIASTFSISFDSVIEFITLSLPASTSKLILPLFSTKIPDISLTFLIISAIFLASRATKAIIKASNNIYGVVRSSMQDFVKSVIITILLILLFLFIIFILILGEKILIVLSSFTDIGFIKLINILRWPIAILVIFFTIKFIYTLTPNKRIAGKSVNVGSAFATISWVTITYIYSFYVTHYASYNTYYGSASNIVILMLWIYLLSQVFVIGMVMNYVSLEKNE